MSFARRAVRMPDSNELALHGEESKKCPRSELQLTYMIPIALTAEFVLDSDAR
jgi:hypothetical protein